MQKKKEKASANGEKADDGETKDETIADDADDNDDAGKPKDAERAGGADGEENGDEKPSRKERAKKEAGDAEEPRARKKYIRLDCLHCRKHCVTFQVCTNI